MKRELTQTWAGITIHAAYGPITVIPDRNCPSQIAYLLSMDTFKFRSLGKAPHILTYGLEGLEGIRVGNADAKFCGVFKLSLIDLEAGHGNRAQA